jgi:hypothetical protein
VADFGQAARNFASFAPSSRVVMLVRLRLVLIVTSSFDDDRDVD